MKTTVPNGEVIRILRMPLKLEADVVSCRHRARAVASGLRFDLPEQVRLATAISEIARTTFRHARHGSAEFSLVLPHDSREAQSLLVVIRDQGPGVSELPGVLASLSASSDKSIRSVKRLLDRMDIETGPEGTVVRIQQHLPPNIRLSTVEARLTMDEIIRSVPLDSLAELESQNRELLQAFDQVSDQREQLLRMNEELGETNRGVVALYDELDTIYRVGRVVASKLDLESLLASIIQATTEAAGADAGAFFLKEPDSALLSLHATAGLLNGSILPEAQPLEAILRRQEETSVPFSNYELRAEDVPPFFRDGAPVRSYLAIPVLNSENRLVGVMAFAHRRAGGFSDRTERILTTISVQVSIGLENARLYRDVSTANAAKDQFLAVLSHELRTPLNPVFAILTDLFDAPGLAEEVRADLEVIRRNLQLEARLIDDLLDLTRIVKGKVPLQREIVDMHHLIQSAVQTCQASIEKRRVKVTLDLHAGHFRVFGDSARLQQVLWNLLNNAVKFTPPHGRAAIATSLSPEGALVIQITDTGRGMEAGVLPRIFRPFEQGDPKVTALFGGLGLGLAISRSIVEAHEGTIRAESPGRGRGSSFYITLPVCHWAPPPVSTGAAPGGEPPPLRLRVLLVDDHEDTRIALSRLLSRRGHAVTTAGSVREARLLLDEHTYDLLISDVGLPDGSGHDILQLVPAGTLPGIALSGFGMEADIERSLAAGFATHLIKPLDFPALETAIEKIARPKSPE